MSRTVLAWKSLAGVLYYIVSTATAFVMAPFLVHHLGNSGYGFWELIVGLVGYLGILDLGVAPAVMRHVALAWGKGNKDSVIRVINTGFAAFLVAGLAGAVLVSLVSIQPDIVFGKLPFKLSQSRDILFIMSIVFLLTFTRATFTASLLGLQHHRIVNSLRSVLHVSQAVAIWILLTRSNTDALLKIASVSAASLFIESLIDAFILSRILRCGFNPLKAKWTESKELFCFGFKSVGLMSAGSLTKEGLLFILSHTLGAAFVTFYVLASRMLQYGVQLLIAVGFPITPYLSTSLGHKGIDGVRESFEYTTRIMQFLQGGIGLGLFWLGLPFLARWMGPEYAIKGSGVFYILTASFCIGIFSVNSTRTLLSLNKHGKAAGASVVLSILAFGLALYLVPKLGLAGAAWAAIFFQLSMGAVQLVLVAKALGFSVLKHLKGIFERLSIPVFIGAIAIAFSVKAFPPITYKAIFLSSLIGGGCYLFIGFFTVPTHRERKALYDFVRGKLTGATAAPG